MIARFTSIGLVLAVASSAFGVTIRVPLDAPTIQIAISNAMPFDTIIVDTGTYFEAISFGGKVITVQSTNPNNPAIVAATIIDAGGLGSVVTFSGGEDQTNTILDGFTITGGTKGIEGNSSLAVIKRCVIRDNSSVGISQADGRIEDCQILNNENVGLNDCDGDIQRCLVDNNKNGGTAGCDGTIVDTIIENTRSADGTIGGTADIVRCTIRLNERYGVSGHNGTITQSLMTGNGIYGISGGSGLIDNCVIAGNGGSGFGNSSKTVLSCTVTGNRQYGFINHTGAISHVILWDNLLGPLSNSSTPLFSGTANPFFVQPGFFDQFSNMWVDGNYNLTQNSPFIDAGDPLYLNDPTAPIEDIDGNPRVVGARIDIGAYEFQAACAGQDFDGDGTFDNCDRDIDDDGILNVPDQCDFTPMGIPVNADGRPLADQNSDCVVDLLDYAEFQLSLFGPTP